LIQVRHRGTVRLHREHFADIKNRVITAMRQAGALGPQLEEVSRIFWRSAAAEFRAKMKAAESPLRFVEADIPKAAKALFVQVLKRDIESISTTIQKLIDAQSWFSSAGSREQLRKSLTTGFAGSWRS
jgi:hypothetical protein